MGAGVTLRSRMVGSNHCGKELSDVSQTEKQPEFASVHRGREASQTPAGGLGGSAALPPGKAWGPPLWTPQDAEVAATCCHH